MKGLATPRLQTASASKAPTTLPMLSAIRSFIETVRGGKKTCVNSTPTASTTPNTTATASAVTRHALRRSRHHAARNPSGAYSTPLAIQSARDSTPKCRNGIPLKRCQASTSGTKWKSSGTRLP